MSEEKLHSLGIQANSKIAVIGLGMTGYSVATFLDGLGVSVQVFDTRSEPNALPKLLPALKQGWPKVNISLGELDANVLCSFDILVVSPGVAISTPAIKQAKQSGVEVIGDIELFARINNKPLLAITGSNGKSTVATLLARLLEATGLKVLLAGNIGKPVLEAWSEHQVDDQREYDIVVLELSSFQLETTFRLDADVACILNVSADHMDRYDSMGDYVLAKQRIFRGAKTLVLPRHDSQLSQFVSASNELYTVELDEPKTNNEFGLARISGQRWLMRGKNRLVPMSRIKMQGLHNVNNALAALAFVYACTEQGIVEKNRIDLEKVFVSLKSFNGLAHRTELVASIDQVDWINDSKATNVGAAVTALTSIDKPIVWLLGGQSKGADLSQLDQLIGTNVKAAVLFGQDAEKFAVQLKNSLPVFVFDTLDAAVEKSTELAEPGDAVLLSPACASFDQFSGFEQRGDYFRSLVGNLNNGSGGAND